MYFTCRKTSDDLYSLHGASCIRATDVCYSNHEASLAYSRGLSFSRRTSLRLHNRSNFHLLGIWGYGRDGEGLGHRSRIPYSRPPRPWRRRLCDSLELSSRGGARSAQDAAVHSEHRYARPSVGPHSWRGTGARWEAGQTRGRT